MEKDYFMLSIRVLTLFPDMFPGPLGDSLSGKALEKGLWSLEAVDIRGFTEDVHKTVDDTPFGGGAGMVMKPDIVSRAVESVKPRGRMIFLSPRGKPLTQDLVKELAAEEHLTLLCGRYEGLDQRVIDYYDMEEVSIGDYVLSGGELGAMVLMDACVRLLDGVMGNADTPEEESFENGLLEYPHYTRPSVWEAPDGSSHPVPEILTSGHHAKIAAWRHEQAERLTEGRRPDLWEAYTQKKAVNSK
ncbi:MAG: tRNA (guanosine(37)-N1)-methyltransferase TrmD [Alphaproteobacteria bacterium]|nr:MAG: tRNA (guanosine(37)-N1)-methyltransferase TrmD [Alphaproteobacteria bacterium]